MTTTAETRKYGTIEDFNKNNFDKRYVFVLNHNNQAPSMQGRYFPSSFSLKLEDTIFDTETSRTRTIRVIDGEVSIYKDEQTAESHKREAMRSVFSPNGDLIVEGRETNTLKFFLKSNFNGNNPNRNVNSKILYYMLDLKQGLSSQMEKDKTEAEAFNWCYNGEFKHIIRYARVIGIDINRDADEIRWTLRELAKKDPKKFMDGLKNKYTVRKFYVLEAIDKGYVTVDRQANSMIWHTGSTITTSPMGKDPIDHFVDLSLSTTDMDMTYRTLQELIEPTKKEVSPVEPPVQVTHGAKMVNTDEEIQEVIKKSLAKGTVKQNKAWFYFKDKKFKGRKFNEALALDKELFDHVKLELSEKTIA